MSLPWCGGSDRVIVELVYTDALTDCPVCGIEVTLKGGYVPPHRRRRCLIPMCLSVREKDGLCARHNRHVVERDALLDGFELPDETGGEIHHSVADVR